MISVNRIVTVCTFLFAILLTSCNKDEPTPLNQAPSENSWKLDAYTYTRRTSTQTSTTYTNGDPFTLVYIDSNIATDNNQFANCSLIITFNTSTPGEYGIKSQATTLSNSPSKYMHVKCIVLSGSGKAAWYESTDGNLNASIALENDNYVITIPAGTTLTRTFNDNLPEAPDNFVLTANQVR